MGALPEDIEALTCMVLEAKERECAAKEARCTMRFAALTVEQRLAVETLIKWTQMHALS